MKITGKVTRLNNSVHYTIRVDGEIIPNCYFGDGSFSWGYNGIGPRDTAQEILYQAYAFNVIDGNIYESICHVAFMREVVSKLPDNWELTDKEILQWIENHKKTQLKA